ncbi:TetR/AcrR family transcriptional regulator [Euzebya sp.]|uniref:TetR/AcrR family transcriptional regulator n=1 Tax=Euzebya sp. TaxID=1971409 RepID=UPI003513A50B
MDDRPAQRVYGGVDADERHARRRGQLLAAGLERFAADGWADATVAGICETAGLSRRYFYEHAADREALFLAVVDHVADEVEGVIRAAAATPDVVPVDRARLVLEALAAHFAADPRTIRVALVESLATPAFRARRRELLARFSDLAVRLMAALREDAPGRAVPDPAAARITGALLTGGLVELLIAWATDGTPRVAPDELIDHIVDLATAAARL